MQHEEESVKVNESSVEPTQMSIHEEVLTQNQTNDAKKKRNYSYIKLGTRQRLISLVYKEGFQIKEAAQMIGMNYSTAKHIIKIFKRTGSIETKLMIKNKMSPIDIGLLE